MENNERVKVLVYGLFRGGEHCYRTTIIDFGISCINILEYNLPVPGFALFKKQNVVAIAIRSTDPTIVLDCDLLDASRMAYLAMKRHANDHNLHEEVVITDDYGMCLIFVADHLRPDWIRMNTGSWKDSRTSYSNILKNPEVKRAMGFTRNKTGSVYKIKPEPSSRWPTDEYDSDADPYADENIDDSVDTNTEDKEDDDSNLFDTYNLSGD